MTLSALLLVCSLITVVLSQSILLMLSSLKESKRNRLFLETLWKVESRRVQTMLNLMTAKDFPMFAGMQQMTQQNMESQPVSVPAAPFLTTSSEYIPRDDVTEALRMHAFGQPGYGEAIFDEDPEAAMMLSELIGGGQNDMVGKEDNE